MLIAWQFPRRHDRPHTWHFFGQSLHDKQRPVPSSPSPGSGEQPADHHHHHRSIREKRAKVVFVVVALHSRRHFLNCCRKQRFATSAEFARLPLPVTKLPVDPCLSWPIEPCNGFLGTIVASQFAVTSGQPKQIKNQNTETETIHV